MPGSFPIFDAAVAHLVRSLAPRTALDIGCGAGKYGKLLQQEAPQCRRIGVEVEASYVERFGLRTLYDEVRIGDAQSVLALDRSEAFDLAIIGDCIEHMPKSVGMDLLNALTYRTQYTIVLAPEFIVQGAVAGVESEAHVSVWSEFDMLWHDRWAWDNCLTISVFVLRGYQQAPLDFDKLIDGVNAANVPLVDFTGRDAARTAQFKKQVRQRQDVFEGQPVVYRPQ
ncbi:MAG: class I SAM-dependent methyltransferase [Burkholderiales bacterium]|nr:class I SAM-dependent methyltransferase [Burkholderiales bacterium]